MSKDVFVYAASLNFGNAPASVMLTPGVLCGYRIQTDNPNVVGTALAVVPVLDSGVGPNPIPLGGLADNADSVSPSAIRNRVPVIARLTAYNEGSDAWDRLRVTSDAFDESAAVLTGLLATVARGVVFNGLTFDRARSPSAQNLAAFRSTGGQMVAEPGEWSVNLAPAAAVQATASRAAGGIGVRHVCRSITVTIAAVAIQPPLEFVVRDGATGVDAVLWRGRLSCVAGDSRDLSISGLNIIGSANTAMTVESVAAPAATNFATVTMTGYDAI